MHISIAGRLGSGKSTICNKLKSKHGFHVYSTGAIHREIAREHNVSTLEMNSLMAKDLSFDHAIDDAVTRISVEREGETIVFDSRMAWNFAVNSFKIFVTVDPLVAAQRVLGSRRGEEEVYSDLEEAKLKLIERGRLENERFIDIYGVDNFDYLNYDLVIDSTFASSYKLTELVYEKFRAFNGEKKDILLSPASLYPLADMSEADREKLRTYIEEKDYLYNYITIAVLDGYHYIVDGHYRVLAAIVNGEDFVNVVIANPAEYPYAESLQSLICTIENYNIASVKAFEELGRFCYKSYPSYYIRH